MIDSAFADQAHLSPDFVAAARRQVQGSDVVVFSHPWVYPLVRDVIDPERQLVVYDAHNVEGLLRMRLLDDHGGVGTRVVRSVVRQEHELCHAADLVLACSHEDRLLFEGLYGLPSARMRVAPNGVFCDRILPASPEDKRTAREELGLGAARVVLFLGSAYAPNIEAARLVADRLAPAFPDVLFVVAGGVGEAFSDEDKARRANLRVTGLLSEEDKRCWLAASELAVNPMLSGSGTNIKMFDFMAAGLPVLTTPVGARGIEAGAEAVFERREPTDLARGLALLLGDARRRDRLGEAARSTG